jgi:CubicO group peptidase (beta-lactamase class C family)
VCVLLLVAGTAFAEFPPSAVPECVGLSSERLARIGEKLQADIDEGLLPGALVLVYRRGRIAYFETFGVQDPDTGVPMAKDSIFRIYSMTKPIVSVAVMMLVEEGKIAISEPVSNWIPELGGLEVAIEDPEAEGGATLVPAKRDMTVQDLLRHTSGLTYGVFGDSWVKRRYKEAGIQQKDQTTAEMTAKLGELPLMYQPGEVWEYSRSTDVLGTLVEVVSGQPLDDFLKERILDPLGMTDTGFYIPPGELHRAAQPQVDPATGKKPDYIDVAVDPVYLSGGGGLVSTTHDYLRFTRMMLGGGSLDGIRLLGRQTVEFMTANHLAPGMPMWFPGYGFGLGFAVRTERGLAAWPSSPGEYWWAGYAGTLFWIDPAEDMIVLYMTQQTAMRQHYREVIRNLAGQAIID